MTPLVLPDRGHVLVRGAYVMTMDPALGELPDADVELRDGDIVSVGLGLDAPGAEVVDGTGAVLMPGFVDTHWHAWGTLMRGVIGDGHANGWFSRKGLLGPHYTPADTAAGARLALAEGLAAGITTVHDWAHNVMSREDADANVAADLDLGLRVRWSWGAPSTTPGLSLDEMKARLGNVGAALNVDEPMDIDQVARLRDDWLPRADGRLTVAVNVRGPSRSTSDVFRREFEDSRGHGFAIAMHCAGTAAEVAKIRQVQVLREAGLLGPDLIFAHGNHLPAEDIALVAEHGIGITVSPLSELRLAMGFLQVAEFRAAGVRTSFSLDTTAIAASADPFQAMRVAVGLEAVRNRNAESLSPRAALEMATIDGARSLGLGDVTGSITPGKRADLVLVRIDGLNTSPAVDPAVALVHSAGPADVDLVIADGRVLKRDGALTAADPAAIAEEARERLAGLCARAGFDPRPAPAPAAAH
jgi:5-methylthioadenosine/S-adenosylhomocysteine deaminase